MQHYLNGVWAIEVGRWDLAVQEFQAAGTFRDAPARLEQARSNFHQVQARYEQALLEMGQRKLWNAAYLLEQVVAAIPDYRSSELYLQNLQEWMGKIVLVRRTPDLPTEEASSIVLASPTLGQEQPLEESVFEGVSAHFSPDGKQLVYEALDDGKLSLALVEVASGARVHLVERAHESWARWSADSENLLYGFKGELGWAVSLYSVREGQSRLLLSGADLATGDFSPAGRWILLWERRGNAWKLYLSGTSAYDSPRVLVERADSLGLYQWSSGESQLAYGFLLDGAWHLFVAGLPDALPQPVVADAEYAWLLFQPQREGRYALWRAAPGGGELSLHDEHAAHSNRLLHGPADAWARWSPDGRWLLTSDWDGRSWQLQLFDLVAGDAPQGAQLLGTGVEEWDVRFSADSRFVLYQLYQDGLWRVAARDLETGAEHLLLADALAVQSHWAPDSEHVLLWWSAPRAGEAGQQRARGAGTLSVATVATGQRITLRDELSAVQGAFSRDGSKMGFAMQPVGGRASVWVADADGTNLLELDRSGYRLFWASAPFHFGPRLPGP